MDYKDFKKEETLIHKIYIFNKKNMKSLGNELEKDLQTLKSIGFNDDEIFLVEFEPIEEKIRVELHIQKQTERV